MMLWQIKFTHDHMWQKITTFSPIREQYSTTFEEWNSLYRTKTLTSLFKKPQNNVCISNSNYYFQRDFFHTCLWLRDN